MLCRIPKNVVLFISRVPFRPLCENKSILDLLPYLLSVAGGLFIWTKICEDA